ncbi:hypothetical protein OHA72_38555 [Dactylosporangium sp. NBC_01737]|uniref:hypothetical protein n=1 Tax=Dactylosporangium sp. NBC_01737 TaxID=2975959 RepID=UPI002E1301C2|nr:hypothetical protein OHA72_38555 [Dactylosporangium sp. NBC_01737]
MVVDEALLRMRRNIERAGLISRSVAVVWILTSFLALPRAAGLALPGPKWLLGAAMALPEVLINVVAVYALRNVANRRYPRLSATLVAADTATIIAIVYASSSGPRAGALAAAHHPDHRGRLPAPAHRRAADLARDQRRRGPAVLAGAAHSRPPGGP